MRIGFVGLGIMEAAMAANLLGAGHEVTVFNRYLDLITSTLFGAPIYKTYGELIAGERFEPAGFAASLGQKDIRLVLAAAEELQVPMPVAGLVRDRFLTLLARGGADLDWSAVGALAAWEAGGTDPTDR